MRVGSNFAFNRVANATGEYSSEVATAKGVGTKTALLLGITFFTTLAVIGLILVKGHLPIIGYAVATILTLILQIIMCFSPVKARGLAIPYAISEGLILGCLCGILEVALPGQGLQIAAIALLITVSVFLASAFLYAKGYIQVGRRFYGFLISLALGIVIFTFGFMILSLVMFFTNGTSLYAMFYSSGLGLGLSIIMCIIAALYVIASLNTANNIIESGCDKVYEWFAAYAITLNVIYLFVEIIRLVLMLVMRNKD